MANENAAVTQPAEVTEEPTIEVDVREAMSMFINLVRDQEKRITAQDEVIFAMQKEISLLGKAVYGHQQIIEASQPEPEPLPPGPPTDNGMNVPPPPVSACASAI